MPKTVILSAARTPIGKLGGGLSSIDATELGGTAITAALDRAEVAPEEVQHVIMGQVLQAGQGQIPSRQAQIKAGIPNEVSSDTVNKVDEAPRRETTLEVLSKLPPQFVKDGSHTAGNSPGVNDGAGALVLSSDEWAKQRGRTPLATIVAQAQVADDFAYLARTPGKAAKKALDQAGLSAEQIDLW